MAKIAVTTDSNSGITQAEGKRLGVRVIPTPFFINGEMFLEDITLTREEFYQRLDADADISTSQPSPGDLEDAWTELLKDYDAIIHIPISRGLSTACETAAIVAQDEPFAGRVFVVDNQRVSITQRQSVLDALEMIEKGMEAQQIAEVLLEESLQSSIYITVDTLKYLKKGGRVTPAGAALGAVLNIKPVLQIQGDKLDAFAKVRGMKAARLKMLDAMEKDIRERFAGQKVHLMAAYTCTEEEAAGWAEQIRARFPDMELEMLDPLSLSVSCHIGKGSMAIACSRVIQ